MLINDFPFPIFPPTDFLQKKTCGKWMSVNHANACGHVLITQFSTIFTQRYERKKSLQSFFNVKWTNSTATSIFSLFFPSNPLCQIKFDDARQSAETPDSLISTWRQSDANKNENNKRRLSGMLFSAKAHADDFEPVLCYKWRQLRHSNYLSVNQCEISAFYERSTWLWGNSCVWQTI